MTRTSPPKFWSIVRATPVALAGVAAMSCGGGGGGYNSGNSYPTGTQNQTVASVSITGNATSVAVGSSITLSASALNSAGTVVSSTISWSSSNTAIATVGSSTGVVTGVAAGVATISASAGGVSGTRVITVSAPGTPPPPATSATISMPGTSFEPNAVTLAQGGTVSFVFTAITHNVVFSAGSGVADIGNSQNTTITRTFNTKGTFNIQCTIHVGMSGSITVQ